jgi:hypothetical protein
VRKKSQISASHPTLLGPFQGIKCNGLHEHAQTWGCSKKLQLTQIWTWEFANTVVQGILFASRGETAAEGIVIVPQPAGSPAAPRDGG